MSSTIDAPAGAGSGVPASPPRENLYRAQTGITLLRSAEDAMPTLAGHFAVFDTWTHIRSAFEGNFMERIAPGAFKKTIAEGRDQMRVMFDHGQDPTVGNKVLGTIKTLREDQIGAYYEVPLFDTSYNRDLVPMLEGGVLGASFRFRVMKEEFVAKPKRSADNPDGIPQRTIMEAQVKEFGPVVWGAYPTATAGLRSVTDQFRVADLMEDPEQFTELLELMKQRAAQISVPRDMEPEPPAATTPPEKQEVEPEPSEATTRSPRDLFWFAETPKHMRSK